MMGYAVVKASHSSHARFVTSFERKVANSLADFITAAHRRELHWRSAYPALGIRFDA